MSTKKIFGLFAAISVMVSVQAQDFHYTLYHMSPQTLNPANTGAFTGDIRVINNYRMQWFTVSSPYKTLSAAVDGAVFRGKMQGSDFFAAGFVFNNDQAGTSSFKTNRYDLSMAFHKDLSGTSSNYVTLGFQAGLGQQSINLANMSWDIQHNGLQYDPTLPSFEGGGSASIWFDYSTGLLWTYTGNERFKNSIGASLLHIGRPNVGVYGGDKLYRKFNLNWTAQIALGANSNAILIPNILFSKQGPNRLVNAGAGVKYLLQERSHYTGFNQEKSFTIGGAYRLMDAASAYVRFDYGGWGLGFNYDFNISELTTATKGIGALEFMAIYTGMFGSHKNTRLSSPSFF